MGATSLDKTKKLYKTKQNPDIM